MLGSGFPGASGVLANAMLEAIQKPPFALSAEDAAWVVNTLGALPQRRKLAQLFNLMLVPQDAAAVDRLAAEQPGAVTQFMLGGADAGLRLLRQFVDASDIALLVSADAEGGAIALDGMTPMSNQLGMAAMNAPQLYGQAVDVMAREAAALGINWSLTPVVDINAEMRSAIVATRSFGSDLSRIEALARVNVRAMQRAGLAATAKHWPGEGYDARDQHLVTTINPLSMEAWRERFGRLFSRLIEDGVMSVMSAHIALPAYAAARGVEGLERYRPASVSRLLNQDLLRGELGFNGVIVSDATPMAGLSSWGPREAVLPEVVENGCDMILFSPDLHADLDLLQRAMEDGRLSERRVDEAVTRVLAMKAALGLHRRSKAELSPDWQTACKSLATQQHKAMAQAVAAASPTLVKDTQGLLPLSPQRHRRVVLVTDPSRGGFVNLPVQPLVLDRLLTERGFDVRAYDPADPPKAGDIDLMVFVLAQESLLTQSNIYLDWVAMLGAMDKAMTRLWHQVPTMLVSFGHPYYLYDAPRMPCVINAYAATEPVQQAVVRKLMGEEPFAGISPVDPFCGLPDARY
jgi:beta-N-acetylhexosaminidase